MCVLKSFYEVFYFKVFLCFFTHHLQKLVKFDCQINFIFGDRFNPA